MPDFFMRTRKKLGGGGGVSYTYTQILYVYSKNITAWGGEILPNFFMRTWKGGLYSNFWCVMKEYYCECGGGGAYARFFMRTEKLPGRGGRVIPKFLVCTQRILLRVWGGGAYARFFCAYYQKILGEGGGVYTQIFGVYSKNITASVGGGAYARFFYA